MLDNKRIFITGGTGSWGNELISQLLNKYNPLELVIYSRGEHKQVEMSTKFPASKIIKYVIGDVRDKSRMLESMRGMDMVIHLAALKHVPVCENNTWESVLTNIVGTQNVIECAISHSIETVVDISTDKAVDPFNHYGVTKACAEKMIVNASFNYNTRTKFVCIRGGNVLGTNGSVIPLFKKQIKDNDEITITDPNMTRYLMTTKEAISLVFEAIERARGGEIFVMRMDAIKVDEIANAMIGLFGSTSTKKKIIGSRPGEKMDEVLVSRYEAPFTRVLNDKYYVVLPQRRDVELETVYNEYPKMETKEFNSKNAAQINSAGLLKKLKNEKWLMK
jgi:UDP-N-acetylglucosamine 4,6-dehydratase/5-epimerase